MIVLLKPVIKEVTSTLSDSTLCRWLWQRIKLLKTRPFTNWPGIYKSLKTCVLSQTQNITWSEWAFSLPVCKAKNLIWLRRNVLHSLVVQLIHSFWSSSCINFYVFLFHIEGVVESILKKKDYTTGFIF